MVKRTELDNPSESKYPAKKKKKAGAKKATLGAKVVKGGGMQIIPNNDLPHTHGDNVERA